VETQPALVGTDSVVELHTKSLVYLGLATVIHPWNPEKNGPVRLHDAFVDAGLNKLGVPLNSGFQCFKHLFNSLMELGFAGIVILCPINDLLDVTRPYLLECALRTESRF